MLRVKDRSKWKESTFKEEILPVAPRTTVPTCKTGCFVWSCSSAKLTFSSLLLQIVTSSNETSLQSKQQQTWRRQPELVRSSLIKDTPQQGEKEKINSLLPRQIRWAFWSICRVVRLFSILSCYYVWAVSGRFILDPAYNRECATVEINLEIWHWNPQCCSCVILQLKSHISYLYIINHTHVHIVPLIDFNNYDGSSYHFLLQHFFTYITSCIVTYNMCV